MLSWPILAVICAFIDVGLEMFFLRYQIVLLTHFIAILHDLCEIGFNECASPQIDEQENIDAKHQTPFFSNLFPQLFNR